MKKMIFCLLLASSFAACNSDTTTKSEADSKTNTTGPGTPGVENVNGNIPDTSNSVTLNKPLPKDSSSVTDSARH